MLARYKRKQLTRQKTILKFTAQNLWLKILFTKKTSEPEIYAVARLGKVVTSARALKINSVSPS
jgi:hypothetical protein